MSLFRFFTILLFTTIMLLLVSPVAVAQSTAGCSPRIERGKVTACKQCGPLERCPLWKLYYDATPRQTQPQTIIIQQRQTPRHTRVHRYSDNTWNVRSRGTCDRPRSYYIGGTGRPRTHRSWLNTNYLRRSQCTR